ncbi:hypothetical protein DBR11_21125, partial [Pedobacter sp. HMWF019]|uniref:DUF6443 domain-containing protein n=1 Tax=Pedobacter sp. HMWF019 TaxID=2056856 RepID=UPI000D3615F4
AGASNGTGTAASFYNPLNTAVDAAGNVYVADGDNHQIRKITPAGVVTTLAGSGYGGYADGTGAAAVFQHPAALAVDASGNVFVSDQQNHRIRKVTPAGVVTTFAGSGSIGSANGTGTAASFYYPIGLAFDGSGNLYVADSYNNKIRMITPAGVVSNFAGSGTQGASNGAALSASFNKPMGVAFDQAGALYVADRYNHMVRKISSGVVSTLAGSGSIGSANGTGTAASFNYVNSVAVDLAGNIYVVDYLNNMIRKITPAGVVTSFAGTTTAGSVNGTGSVVRYNGPYGISIDSQGNLYLAENANNMIRKIATSAFNIYPNLPAGLSFNNANGTISGTPATITAAANYQIQAFNTTNSSNVFSLNLAVTGAAPSAVQASQDQNYVLTYTPNQAGLTSDAAVISAGSDISKVQADIQYFDGLGRPLQAIQVKGSPTLRDVITPMAYDTYGREDKKYLPYSGTVAASNGSYKVNAVTEQTSFYTDPTNPVGWGAPGVTVMPGAAFSKTVFEASPLNRVVEQGAPGSVWQPAASRTATTGRTATIAYGSNNSSIAYSTTGFAVRMYNADVVAGAGHEHERTLSGTGYYGANQLHLSISRDENWTSTDGKVGTVEEYKDKEDRVVLKRFFNLIGTTIETLSTYYVYDDLGNLSFVLPPGASPDAVAVPVQTTLDNFCYQYRYDGRKRLIEKKVPGKGWEFMVYNKLDQVVASQDAVQRSRSVQDWQFNKYDAFGRVIQTGIYTYSVSTPNYNYRSALQATIDGQPSTITLWENRIGTGNGYSNQCWPTTNVSATLSLNYYDDYNIPGLPAVAPFNQSASYSSMTKSLLTASQVNVLGTSQMLWTVNYYDNEARVVRSIQQHYKGAAVSNTSYDDVTNTYSFVGEVLTSTRRHYVNGTEQLYAANRYTYDYRGRAKDKYQKTGDNISTTNAEVLLSRKNYNEVGQLTNKQLYSTNSGSSFAQTVSYAYNPRGWLKSQSAPLFTQNLKYEDILTGVTSQYNGNISRQEWGTGKYYNYIYDRLNRLNSAISDENHNELIGYDVMGNISRLQRKQAGALVDQLKYTYTTGNRLDNVLDSTTTNTSAAFQLPGTTSYTYDLNGNISSRSNAAYSTNNLTSITYNYLNLPSTMTAGAAAVNYTYDATGNKLSKQVPSISLNNEYIRGIQYESGVLKFVSTAEGRVVRNSATSYSYEYTLADHLGNGRVYFDISGGLARKIQETDYYAFGLDIQRSLIGTENKYQYNGKEKQDQEKLYDYRARFYDPVIGRWSVTDSHGEKYESIGNYSYAFNNPTRFVDIKGQDPGDVVVVFGGADLSRNGDSGGAPLILKQIQEGHLDKKGGVGQAFHSDYWGTSLDDPKSLDKATQYAYDFVLANYNKVGTEDVEGGQIIVQGYSYGGVLANHLAKRLKEAKLDVSLLVTVDAAAGPESSKVDRTIPSNVKKNLNYYQTTPSLIRSRGDRNKKEEGEKNKNTIRNIDVSKITNEHGKIDEKLFFNIVNDILRQLNQ